MIYLCYELVKNVFLNNERGSRYLKLPWIQIFQIIPRKSNIVVCQVISRNFKNTLNALIVNKYKNTNIYHKI